jgi:hypothetical protein
MITFAATTVSALDEKSGQEVPDPRWSMIYVVEDAAPAEAGEVIRHSSLVERALRSPADSPDVAVLPSSTVTQSENSVFVDPNNPDIVFVGNNATDWPVTQVYGTGVYWSFDGGATWTGNDQGPGGVGNRGDPAVTISGIDGRWAVGYISNSGGMGVSYSTNQGGSWSHRVISGAGGLDKNHLMVDNVPTSAHYGNLYSSWVNLGGGANADDIEFSRSTDGGNSWSGVTNISDGVSAGSHNQGINIQIGPGGEVYTAWAIYDSWPSDESAMGFNVSTDGGVSWTGEFRFLTNIRGHRNTSLPNTSIRRNSFPSMAVDVSGGPNHGAIYVVWTNIGVPGVNSGDAEIYLVKSTNGGTTWGTPIRVNQDAGTNDQWFPWISCDPVTGQLAVIFLDRREDPANVRARAYMAVSNDGGSTWEDFAVGDVEFIPVPIPGLAGGYMGDYIGMAIHSGRAFPTWSDNRSGNFLCYVSPILVTDPTDPNPPTDVAGFSDYTTPTSVSLSWTDPTTYADGTPLTDFSIDILRDEVFLVNVDQGIESHVDLGLTDGTEYAYTLRTRDDITDSLSVDVVVRVHAGGSPYPAPPSDADCSADSVSATITWTNPTTQSDGTTLDDFAGIRIYRDGNFLVELARTPADTGSADSYVDNPPSGFLYSYEVAAIDSESPVNESDRVSAGTCFVGSVPGILIWQPADAISPSGNELFTALQTLGESAYLTSDLFEFATDLTVHEVVCVCLGIYSNNHVLNVAEGSALDAFVQEGGRLYLEGGDCFNYDSTYNILPIFGLADGPDGSGDLFGVIGQNDLAGFSFVYAGGNAWIDELQPVTSSAILKNDSNSDIVGVFNPSYGAEAGRAIGASFEFGGLVDAGAALPLVDAHDLDYRLRSPGPWEEPLPAGPNALKERERAELDRVLQPVTERVANPGARRDLSAAPRIPGGMGGAAAAARANTKVDLLAAYLQLLRATGDPVMVTTPTHLEATLYQGETDTQFVTVENPGSLNDDLIFTTREAPSTGWLSVSPAADTVAANGTSIVTVDFDASGLDPGGYGTNILISGNDPANPRDVVGVQLTVLGVPLISVTPDSLHFRVQPLASADDSVTISNLGVGDLDYSLFLAGSSGSDRTEVGSAASSSSGSSRYRGNVYQVDIEVPLKEIEQYLAITSPTSLEFFVYENTEATGTFTKIHSTTVSSGTGTGWYGSGPIEVTLEAGKYYFIGAGWLGNADYYHNGAAVPLPAPVPFGSVLGPSGSNEYPPPASKPIAGGGTILWYQALEYGVPADIEILSPTSGTIPPSGSTVVNLRATGGPDPGLYDAELHIVSNDPTTGDFVVPITIEVMTGTDAPAVEAPRPNATALHPAAPNPFRGQTVVRYDLPRPGRVSLRIYDVSGRLISTLVDGHVDPGYQSVIWDGRDTEGNRVSAGVYFSTLATEEDVIRRKLVLLR